MKSPVIISKIRHFRGHGIHSPFVYKLKREVFMQKTLGGENLKLYNALTDKGIRHTTAKELQNLHNYCNFRDFEIVNGKNMDHVWSDDIFYIFTECTIPGKIEDILKSSDKVSIAILNKHINTRTLIGYTKIERRHYTLIFKGTGMPVQTFKL